MTWEEERYEEELWEARREKEWQRQRWEEEAQLEAYWEYYWSPEGWIDRFYDEIFRESGRNPQVLVQDGQIYRWNDEP